MSGLFGILRFNGGVATSRELDRMATSLAYRAPDGHTIRIDGPVGLGHCLMRVNQEDDLEAQPLRDRTTAVTLVADARLDNREALADAFGLTAAALRTLPDSALILRAYDRWGADCASHLLGDFAFAIWDGHASRLVLARDHMGQRAIHYHRGADFFLFATDVKALWTHADVPRTLSDAAIGRLLSGARWGKAGETSFDGIYGLPGATVMTVALDGSVEQRRYWEPRADPAHEHRDEAYYISAYREVLGEAVACRIRRSLRPPGLIFSGGYDSAAIAGLAGPVLGPMGRRLIAASSVMPEDYRGTIRHARRWVAMCARDMPHLDVHYVTREGRSALSGLEQAFLDTGSSAGAYHFVVSDLLSQIAGAGARVVMDGHGGDYTLHPRGQAALARFLTTLQLRRFISEFRGHLRLVERPWSTSKTLAAMLLPPSAFALWRRARGRSRPAWSDRPINADFARRMVAAGAIDENGLTPRGSPLDMRDRIAEVLKAVTDRAEPGTGLQAALRGLELTRPFHDKRVVELALAIPQDLYVKNGRNRYIACRALHDVYPAEFQTRWRRNDDEIPDFLRMATSIAPQLLAEIARMENSQELSRYVDFSKVRSLLAVRGPDDHNSGWEQETQQALRGVLTARYVEWFRRYNR